MSEFWERLERCVKDGSAKKDEIKLYKKLGKTLYHISIDPFYPGLNTHDIEKLTARYHYRVWQSYLENNTPAAGRVFWVYGPEEGEITIVGLEPHPNTKSHSYKSIKLSRLL